LEIFLVEFERENGLDESFEFHGVNKFPKKADKKTNDPLETVEDSGRRVQLTKGTEQGPYEIPIGF
jgi:hypothetical protein